MVLALYSLGESISGMPPGEWCHTPMALGALQKVPKTLSLLVMGESC